MCDLEMSYHGRLLKILGVTTKLIAAEYQYGSYQKLKPQTNYHQPNFYSNQNMNCLAPGRLILTAFVCDVEVHDAYDALCTGQVCRYLTLVLRVALLAHLGMHL